MLEQEVPSIEKEGRRIRSGSAPSDQNEPTTLSTYTVLMGNREIEIIDGAHQDGWLRSERRVRAFFGTGSFCCAYSCQSSTNRRLLTDRDRLSHTNFRDRSPHDGSDLPHLFHEFIKLIGEERLRTVGESLVRPMMYFNQQSVCANCNSCTRKRSDFVALSGPVARVDHDW